MRMVETVTTYDGPIFGWTLLVSYLILAFSAQHIHSIHKILLNLKINIQNIHNIQIHPCSMLHRLFIFQKGKSNPLHINICCTEHKAFECYNV